MAGCLKAFDELEQRWRSCLGLHHPSVGWHGGHFPLFFANSKTICANSHKRWIWTRKGGGAKGGEFRRVTARGVRGPEFRVLDTELWRETSSVTSNAQRVVRYLVHAPWRLNTCSAVHAMSAKNAGWPIAQTLSSCDSSRGRALSDCGSTKCTRARFPTGHLNVGMSRKMPSPSTELFGCLTGMNTLTGVTQQHCSQLIHGACCPAPGRCGVWFAISLHIYAAISETSLCSIACMRPELVCAECCDIDAAFGATLSVTRCVPTAASLKFCEQFYLRTSRWWSFADA